jgi:oxygen-independent coproporphyrinogen-3 oxidase
VGGTPAGALTAAHPAEPRANGHPSERPPIALYVHVPFCVSACPYCDFVVYAGAASRGPHSRVGALVEALGRELELRADLLDRRFGSSRPPLRSVYLGGGTPSLVPCREIGRLLERVASRFGIDAAAEVTLEANPGPAEIGDLAGFRSAGVTRLSIGAQSLQAGELRRLGRRHLPRDVDRAVSGARAAGFASVSLDLLYDVPTQTLAGWQDTLERVVAMRVDHVSAYALTLDDPDDEGLTGPLGDHLPVRPGARRWRERARRAQDDDLAADEYLLADRLLATAGYGWYELSNWARAGHESRHNLCYWRREPYEALGPGAHAFDGGRLRRWNAARLEPYLAALLPPGGSSPRLPPGAFEWLDSAGVPAERAILGLRLAEGIAPELAGDPAVAPAVGWGRRQGLLEGRPDGRVRLTPRGRLLGNEVFARIRQGDALTPRAAAC